MEMSEQVGELFGALAKAHGEMANPTADSNNPHFKSKYADLAEVINAYRKPLANHGLALTQLVEYLPDPEGACLTTILGHSSGQFIRCRMKLLIAQHTNHGLGTSITYLRRYSAAAILSIAQEDKDGNEEPAPKDKKSAIKVEDERPVVKTISKSLANELTTGMSPELLKKVLEYYRIPSLEYLPESEVEKVRKSNGKQ